MSLPHGTRLGPYEIVSPIGAGGMGEVYRAKDTRLNRDVAIKVLPTSFAGDPDRRARFEREAQAVAALSHPNVIAIFDTGLHDPSTGSGQAAQLYVVMELLGGATLRERLMSGALPVRKAVEIAVQIARGLGAAHGKNLVHRDLKPENIFLLEDGQVKILDFGLARQTSDSDPGGATRTMAQLGGLTGAGTVLGTVGYMAPEQVRGQAVDARADVFAFGAVLYEMVSGQRAYQRDTAADTMTAILTQDPPELIGSRPDLSPALDRIIRHCLEKNANERFQNARDVAFALEALSGSNVSTTGSGAAAAIPAAPTTRPRTGVVVAAAVVGALVLGASAGYFGRGTVAPTSAGVADVTYNPVSFEEGFVFAARFAPDNRTVVYSADWDDQPRGVFVTSLDSLDYRSLGFPGADLLGISRSNELAILTGSNVTGGNSYYRIGTMARASLTGGPPRAELENVRFADFSPDNAMAVVREDSLRQTIEYPVGHVIAEAVLAGSQLGSGRTPFSAPRVSRSGDYVAYFDLRVRSAYTVKVFNRAGELVTESQPFADWWALAWTPSNEVWFAARRERDLTSIYALDLKGHQRTVYRAPGAITLHDISSDGDVLVSIDQGHERLELLGPRDAAPQDRTWREGGRTGALSNDRAVLIDGNGDSGGPRGSVYFSASAGAQPVRISDGSPLALSRDGAKALVLSLQSPPKLSIVPTGAGQTQTLDLGSIEAVPWAGWLPDGRVAVQVMRPGAKFETLLISADGQKSIALLPQGMTLSASNVGADLVSPGGTAIIAIDQEGHVVMCTISPSSCHPLTGTALNESVAGWSADGRSVFVYSGTTGTSQVDRVDVTTGKRTPWKTLHPLAPAVSGMRNIIAAPDGTLLYGYSNNKSQLYVIKGLK